MTRIKTLFAAAATALALAVSTPATSAFADGHSQNIVQVAAGNDTFATLVAAVQAGDLVDTLSGDGPFTVFAPTNEAFAALPEGTVETLLKPENKDQLVKILTSHVVAGEVDAATLVGLIEKGHGYVNVSMVSGDVITARVTPSGKVYVFDESQNVINVTATDVKASNGVIHVIDKVLLPK
ncbi:MAG: fasciclin domain-containing protein [Pseudomonadota bacterium]